MKRSDTIANKVYKYVHEEDVWILTNLTGRDFENNWLKIENNGKIIVKGSFSNGYAWDGCSPKWHFVHLIWGTPDGMLDYRTEKPITYYASMIHDVVYQFKKEVDISRKEVDILFKLNLKESKFLWWRVYSIGVKIGGGFYGKWKRKRKDSQNSITIIESSWLETFANTNKLH